MKKIGFVGTYDQNESENQTGNADYQDDGDNSGDFWMAVAMEFFMVYGALAVCKDVVLFLKSMKERD